MQRAWLAVLTLSLGCASLPIRPPDAAALAEADRQVLDGCYDCLLGARAVYERIAVGRARPLVLQRLFEVQVLIVLRERELSLDSEAALHHARTLAAELPRAPLGPEPPAPPLDGDRVLTLVDLVPADSYGGSLDAAAERVRSQSKVLAAVPAEFAWLDASPLGPAARTYLRMSIECAYGAATLNLPRRPMNWKPDLPADPPPLLVYRRARCGTPAAADFLAVRDRVPAFVETALTLGQIAVSEVLRTGQVADALQHVETFRTRFPRSSSATYLHASLHQLLEDWTAALASHDETLALQPAHERAHLGRTESLTRLNRPDDAIRSATRMIDGGMPFQGDALYWRAWNLRALQRLSDARRDIDLAKKQRVGGSVMTLAGMIEYDQGDLRPAEVDLQRALAISSGQDCEAGWYLGLVHLKNKVWPEAAARFEATMACYEIRQLEAESARAALEARDNVDPDFKARQVAALAASIKDSAGQRASSAFNAASFYAQAGNRERAGELIEVAAQDPSLASEVAELRKFLAVRAR